MFTPTRSRTPGALIAAAVATGLLVAACGSATDPSMTGAPSSTAMPGMPGMNDMDTGDGLAAQSSGFRFAPAATSLPAGQPASFQFRISGADGNAVSTFEPDQTKLMHFYLIRSDMTGFQHVHPTMAADGTWTAPLAAVQPGTYRAYVQFIAKDSGGKAVPLVLSQQISVPDPATTTPVPAPSTSTQVDGYALSLGSEQLMAGVNHQLTVTVSKNGELVTDLQPYLDTYAHLTGIHEGDLAFAHLHPLGTADGDHGGPTLTFEAMLPKPGTWQLFVQFQTGGVLHTGAVTVAVS